MEQAFVDLVENPEIVHYCLDKLFGLAYDCAVRIYEAVPGQVDISYIAEDMGGQTDLMISVRHIREFLLPGMKRMIDLAHQAGAHAFHHNDGSCWRIIPDMIGLGIDLLNPLQWRCPGMERERLKKEFGAAPRPPRRHGQPVHAAFRDGRRGPAGGRGQSPDPGRGRRLHPGALPQHPGASRRSRTSWRCTTPPASSGSALTRRPRFSAAP